MRPATKKGPVPSEYLRQLGTRIKVCRIGPVGAGISLSELARRAGIAKSYLARLERGTVANPGLRSLWAISQALGVDMTKLIPGDWYQRPRAEEPL